MCPVAVLQPLARTSLKKKKSKIEVAAEIWCVKFYQSSVSMLNLGKHKN